MGKLAVFPRVSEARARRRATSSPSATVSNVTRLLDKLAKRVGKPQYADPKQTPWQIDVPAAGLTDQLFDVK